MSARFNGRCGVAGVTVLAMAAVPALADQNGHVVMENTFPGYGWQAPTMEVQRDNGNQIQVEGVPNPYDNWQTFGIGVRVDNPEAYMIANVNGSGELALTAGYGSTREYYHDGISRPHPDWEFAAMATLAQENQYAVAYTRTGGTPNGRLGIQYLTVTSSGAVQTSAVNAWIPEGQSGWIVRGITQLPNGNLAVLFNVDGDTGPNYRVEYYDASGGYPLSGGWAASAPHGDWNAYGIAYEVETQSLEIIFQTSPTDLYGKQRRTLTGGDLGWWNVNKNGEWSPQDIGIALDSEVSTSSSGLSMGTVIQGAYGGTYSGGNICINNEGFNLDYSIPASAAGWSFGSAGGNHMTYEGSANHAAYVDTTVVGSKDGVLTVTTDDPTGGESTLTYALSGVVLGHSEGSLVAGFDLDALTAGVAPGIGEEFEVTIYNIGDADLDIDSAVFSDPGLFEFVDEFSPIYGMHDSITFRLRRLTHIGDATLTFGVSDEDLPGAIAGNSLTVSIIPEPGMMALMAFGALTALRRRRGT